ncbi:hypothetical protein [Streptomyces sp. bgisy060]|uniref:hypothetical protein n=1 Tax=Streptomyces sp. bgisy060 TaxID=3413775 RepID=UPI003EB6CE8C
MTDPFLAALNQATRTVIARVRGQLPAAPASSITHTFCCAPDRALCGADDVSGAPGTEGWAQDCMVCVDLEALGCCPGCGAGYGAA